MVARLVAAGHDVSVLGRSHEKRSTIAELGAEAVDEIAAVGTAVTQKFGAGARLQGSEVVSPSFSAELIDNALPRTRGRTRSN